MTWTPLIEVTTEDDTIIMTAAEFRVRSLAMFGAIQHEIAFLNAKFEEAFETGIDEVDV